MDNINNTASGAAGEPTRTIYTPEQQAIIDGLMTAQQKIGVTDKKFAKLYLRFCSETTWGRVRAGLYQVKDIAKVFAELSEALVKINRRIVRQLNATQGTAFRELERCKAMFAAVEECLKKGGQNRLIIHEAPTGCGKSRFLTELDARLGIVHVRANETWAKSYYFAALDILAAMDETEGFRSAGEARRTLIQGMKGTVGVLAIDEGNYFGPSSINLVKDVLNDTEWTVIISLVPNALKRMARHYTEFDQLQRRLHAHFVHEPITAAQTKEFLTDCKLGTDLHASAIALSSAANAFGGFDFIERVIKHLDEDHTAPKLDDVLAAIALVQKELGRAR